MNVQALVPMVEVESVPRSIEFYRKLGFEVLNTFVPPGASDPSWASLRNARAELMVTLGPPRRGSLPPVMLYLYCADVVPAREALVEVGVGCGPVEFPFYAPRGEFAVRDPDGHTVMATHT